MMASSEPHVMEGRHRFAAVEEWVFGAWTPDASLGVISGHRIIGRSAWYWAALVRSGRPLLHVTDFGIRVRSDPFVVKGEALWAEHQCIAPMEQWTIGNETYASSLDEPDEALGRGHGHPTPIAFDLEWYSAGRPARSVPSDEGSEGYVQDGVVHGAIEVLGESTIELVEVPARRWHRWTVDVAAAGLAPIALPVAVAHTGLRAPFAFPDGSVLDLVLNSPGWATRA